MHRTKVVLVAALVLGAVAATGAQDIQRPGTPSELADDALAGALWRIAVATQTRIGFESIEFGRSRLLTDAPPFPVSSRDEALHAALAANPRYEWRRVGDFVVVRPKHAWNDARNPLNRSVRNLRVENATDMAALLGVRDFISTNRFAVSSAQGGVPVSFDVQSGTVIDVLNQLVQSADFVFWNAAYRPNARPDQLFPNWDLQLALHDVTRVRSLSESCLSGPPCLPPQR
jgi:hypothetical protein